MKAELGLVGALLFAVGGAFLLGLLYNVGIAFVGVISFFLISSGLLLIALSGKPDSEQNPS